MGFQFAKHNLVPYYRKTDKFSYIQIRFRFHFKNCSCDKFYAEWETQHNKLIHKRQPIKAQFCSAQNQNINKDKNFVCLQTILSLANKASFFFLHFHDRGIRPVAPQAIILGFIFFFTKSQIVTGCHQMNAVDVFYFPHKEMLFISDGNKICEV